jgi:hypothetical protein
MLPLQRVHCITAIVTITESTLHYHHHVTTTCPRDCTADSVLVLWGFQTEFLDVLSWGWQIRHLICSILQQFRMNYLLYMILKGVQTESISNYLPCDILNGNSFT